MKPVVYSAHTVTDCCLFSTYGHRLLFIQHIQSQTVVYSAHTVTDCCLKEHIRTVAGPV